MTAPDAQDKSAPEVLRFELINPSDPIEFDAASKEVAALAALVTGRGQYSAKLGDDGVIGFAMFGGDGGYQELYGRTIEEGLAALKGELSAALGSFRIIGGAERSSMNNICAYAHQSAEYFAHIPAADDQAGAP